MVARDAILAEATGAPVHIAHLSTAGSVRIVREAKRRGVAITAEATPHHLTLTDAELEGRDPRFKMNPPLRSEEDVAALIEGVADGTIDAFATDHAPHAAAEKAAGILAAPFGIVGLETAVPLLLDRLVRSGRIDWTRFVALWSTRPAALFGLKSQGPPVRRRRCRPDDPRPGSPVRRRFRRVPLPGPIHPVPRLVPARGRRGDDRGRPNHLSRGTAMRLFRKPKTNPSPAVATPGPEPKPEIREAPAPRSEAAEPPATPAPAPRSGSSHSRGRGRRREQPREAQAGGGRSSRQGQSPRGQSQPARNQGQAPGPGSRARPRARPSIPPLRRRRSSPSPGRGRRARPRSRGRLPSKSRSATSSATRACASRP